ncbi:phBC6A51 family helix-turn-helix protein [Aneurinibacillus aneurinilyticus]|jgi:hypothetical protein|uniref:Homeodomain phBC6A51-type domain-containing protein n=1 Tax=Aneurinibacillus aneurinilyticus TaxID=1391 RepID=A0A848D1Y0_ANEAE|nr:phBC6A51 family helix-turn-helix protein [Aneurinibacillus aneurinilyticus]NMF00013.1 hypothetical protein [Aneurinibacillus aneurinilyticus]
MREQTKKLEQRLTAEQIKAAQLIAVNNFLPKNPSEGEQGRLTYEQIAEQSGISVRQLHRWRNYNDDFINYTNALASNAFQSYLPDILEKHLDMTLKGQGSMKGIELFYKFAGLLIDKSEVKTEDTSANQSIDERLARLKERTKSLKVAEETKEDA